MTFRGVALAGVFALLASSQVASAADLVDNPEYKNWAAYKAGTFVSYKTTMSMGPMGMESTMTRTLIEVTPEKAVVEVKMTMNMGGKDQEMPGQKQDIPAKVTKELAEGPIGIPDADKVTIKDMKTGKDTIEVAGNKYDAVTQEFTATTKDAEQKMDMHMKTWTNPTIPGGMLKMEMTGETPAGEGGEVAKMKNTMVLQNIKIVK